MGAGKTSAMINYMNEADKQRHFVFVTPFLDEGKRVQTSCTGMNFQVPESYDDPDAPSGAPRSKMIDFKQFLRAKQNIVTTHALFERFDPEAMQLIAEGNYTLVMDEVASVVRKYDIAPKDARTISSVFTNRDENGMLVWKDEDRDYWGDYIRHKMLCDNGNLWYYNDCVIMQVIPADAFKAFDDVFVMTYMFEAQFQKAYFDVFGMEYKYVYVEGDSPETYKITETPRQYQMPWLKEKIHICSDKKLNLVGEMGVRHQYNMSIGWYEKPENEPLVKLIKNNVYNYFRHHMNASADKALWTVFRERETPQNRSTERKPYFTPRGYSSSFLSCNSRATNAYRMKTVLAYPINRYMQPEIKNFFAERDIILDADGWALSEMVQWIWRSAIRDKKDIWIYIPSSRMRELLENWIEEVSSSENNANMEQIA